MDKHKRSIMQTEQQKWLRKLGPEGRLVLLCSCPGYDEQSAHEIRSLLQKGVDWPAVHRLAYGHEQLPTLAYQLNRIAPDLVPADTMEMLRSFSLARHDQNRFMLEVMLELRQKFVGQGIPVMPFLEVYFGLAAYERFDQRPCRLIDFVIHREDVQAARELLRSLGRWKEHPSDRNDETGQMRNGYLVFVHGPRESAISLHWESAPWLQAVRLDLQEVWERSTPSSFGGHSIPSLSPEDALLYASLSNGETLWVTLAGVCDMAQIVATHPTLRWEELVTRARQSGTLRRLRLGLLLSNELLAVPLPAGIRDTVRADFVVPSLAGEVFVVLSNPASETYRTPQTSRFQLRIREELKDRLSYLLRFVFTPTEVDRKMLRLPSALGFLHSWFRPVRLAGASVWHIVKRAFGRLLPASRNFSGYTPSGAGVVQRMLDLAQVGPADVVYDLGCGDGRIVIEAAHRFGARGVGVDIDAERIRESLANARKAGVEDRVRFTVQDAMTVDIRTATVVAMYLPIKASLQLAPRLLEGLTPGARIVSHNVAPGGWDKVEVCNAEGYPSILYLRIVPERQTAP